MPQAAGSKQVNDALPVLNRILLVTDFSSCSESAVPYAQLLAGIYRGQITVWHVALPDADLAVNEAVIGTPAEIAELAEAQMRAFKKKNALSDADSVIFTGPFDSALADITAEKRFDVLVVGTRGRSGVSKLLLGSVAERIVDAASCPVLSVSQRALQSRSDDRRLHRILYATDMSQASIKALPYALSLANMADAELLMLHVQNPPENVQMIRSPFVDDSKMSVQLSPEAVAVREAPAAQILEGLYDLILADERRSCRVLPMVKKGDPVSVITETAADCAADMIVIGGQPISSESLSRANVPLSIAYRIVAHAPCPVLRVRLPEG